MNTPLYNARQQVTGTINDDGILLKVGLNPSTHQMRHPPGWAIDTAHLETLENQGGTGVELRTTDGTRFTATLETFQTYGEEVDRGEGKQTVLPLKHWHTEDSKQMTLEL
jgi:hypothetical protein